MGSLGDYLKKFGQKNNGETPPTETPAASGGRIMIQPQQNKPKIIIRGPANPRTPTDAGTIIGNDITVWARRKPGKCSICKTVGTVIDNPGGTPPWKCSACGETFS